MQAGCAECVELVPERFAHTYCVAGESREQEQRRLCIRFEDFAEFEIFHRDAKRNETKLCFRARHCCKDLTKEGSHWNRETQDYQMNVIEWPGVDL